MKLVLSDFGERLRRLREERQYTQEQVARYAKIGYSTYRRYETESVLPKVEQLEALARLYGKTIDELLGVGTVYMLEYDQGQLCDLRRVMREETAPEVKWKRLEKTLAPLLEERDFAFHPPEMNMTSGWTGTLRTVRFNISDDQTVLDAMKEMYELKYEAMKI